MTTEIFQAAFGNFSYCQLPDDTTALYLSVEHPYDNQNVCEVRLNADLKTDRCLLARTLKQIATFQNGNCCAQLGRYVFYKDGKVLKYLGLFTAILCKLCFDSDADNVLDFLDPFL